MYDRILVPTDGSTGVGRAVEHAIELATIHDATVHAIYVVNSATFAGLPMEASWDGISDVLREEGEEALELVEELAARSTVPVETRLIDGSPRRAIVEYAEGHDCDLIVMGTHGRGGIDRLLMGSVTEGVIRTSDRPVLTVRRASTADPDGEPDRDV
ncbi:universal stress protein [Natranaeroarchaeum sulfidigenes]|uniref:Nucleotide-binding protein, UspA family n=1 Tax=Natranaeroarchaeum sulfidigenes TaxID=2784880 RepID=A0A897MQ88_9EURY|nr:universal stress protein [Natranaeroarchaeum sulfidigenes]QSG02592.1 Nucleotide-binding protein, UspA family [Natranaeroarchaeum sulfidigenes]